MDTRSTYTLKIPLGRPIGTSEAARNHSLEHLAARCDRVRTAVAWRWSEWARHERDPDGSPIPTAAQCSLYRFGCSVAPEVSTDMVAVCTQEIIKWLRSKRPYYLRRKNCSYNWQAVLSWELQPRNSTGGRIPIKKTSSRITRDESGYRLAIRLWSQQSGRAQTWLVNELQVGRLSPGHRRHLDAICAGIAERCDSAVVRSNNRWLLLLTIKVEQPEINLDRSRVARLVPGGAEDRCPFWCHFDDDSQRPLLGRFGRALIDRQKQLLFRERGIRGRAKSGMRKGHGMPSLMEHIKPVSRMRRAMWRRFAIILGEHFRDAAIERQCGTVEIYDPSLGERPRGWFAQHQLTIDWTHTLAVVRDRCEKAGLRVVDVGRKAKTRRA